MHCKKTGGLSICFTLIISISAFGISFTTHDLYSLGNPGGGFTQVFPTGEHPAADGLVGGQGAHGDNFSHAFLWSSIANPVDLNPAGFTNSYIWSANAQHQVGYAANNRTGLGHGFLWSGTAASGVDLTPAGYSLAAVYQSSDTRQVGSVSGTPNNFVDHAAIWSGTAASFLDINPAGFVTSKAVNLDGTHEIGSGSSSSTSGDHAILWRDGGGAVDLNPAGFTTSEGEAVGGGREVGYGFFGDSDPRALLWHGNSPLAIDLTPEGFAGAIAKDVTATAVVGYTSSLGQAPHAAYWTDSAASFVDLHMLLGPGFVNSQAYSIGNDGTIFGTALDSSNVYHAVSWTPNLPVTGDYNNNGTVDAADYTVWRSTLGRTGAGLAADGTGPTGVPDGVVDQLDYDFWRTNFGSHSGSAAASSANAVVAEPSTLLMLVAGMLTWCTPRRRNVS